MSGKPRPLLTLGPRSHSPECLIGLVTDREAVNLAGTCRSVGRGWPQGHLLPDFWELLSLFGFQSDLSDLRIINNSQQSLPSLLHSLMITVTFDYLRVFSDLNSKLKQRANSCYGGNKFANAAKFLHGHLRILLSPNVA